MSAVTSREGGVTRSNIVLRVMFNRLLFQFAFVEASCILQSCLVKRAKPVENFEVIAEGQFCRLPIYLEHSRVAIPMRSGIINIRLSLPNPLLLLPAKTLLQYT